MFGLGFGIFVCLSVTQEFETIARSYFFLVSDRFGNLTITFHVS